MENNSSLLTSPNITDSDNHELESLEFVVEGILIPMLTCLGLVGNILSITVLHSPGVDMKVNNTLARCFLTAERNRSSEMDYLPMGLNRIKECSLWLV